MLADKLEAAKSNSITIPQFLYAKSGLEKVAAHVVKMTRFSTAHFSKYLKLIVWQHSEKWLILRLNNKVQKHTKYRRRGVLFANTHVRT